MPQKCYCSFSVELTPDDGIEVLSLDRESLQVQGEERKGYDRRMKDLELRLTSILSAKARDDEEHASRVKVSISLIALHGRYISAI